MDATDHKIIQSLATDARKPLSQVARELDMATATVHQRVGKLREAGIIRGNRLRLDWEQVGLPVVATVSIAAGAGSLADLADQLRTIPYIESCFGVSGEFDLLLVVRATSSMHLGEILDEIRVISPGTSRTVVVLNTYFEGRIPPLSAVG